MSRFVLPERLCSATSRLTDAFHGLRFVSSWRNAPSTFAPRPLDEALALLEEHSFMIIREEDHLRGGMGAALDEETRQRLSHVPFILMCGGYEGR